MYFDAGNVIFHKFCIFLIVFIPWHKNPSFLFALLNYFPIIIFGFSARRCAFLLFRAFFGLYASTSLAYCPNFSNDSLTVSTPCK